MSFVRYIAYMYNGKFCPVSIVDRNMYLLSSFPLSRDVGTANIGPTFIKW